VHSGLRAWVRWSTRNFDAGNSLHGWLAWGLAVVGPSLATQVIFYLLDAFLGWPVAMIWSVAILYTTLGFRQFSFHFTQIRDAMAGGDEDRARELLAKWQQIDTNQLPRGEILRHMIEYSVLSAHRHVFGVLTWFSVLAAFGFGPAGAVLYRLSEFVTRYWQYKSKTHHQPISEALQQTALVAWSVIDWVPSRVTAISFAVVGSFEDAIDAWRNFEPRFVGDNDGVVLAATSGAVNIQLQGKDTKGEVIPGQPPELAHLAVVVGLVWRTVVMWMVLLALLTLARLLG
jgi:adenosylcobinamide-phosphate synthase